MSPGRLCCTGACSRNRRYTGYGSRRNSGSNGLNPSSASLDGVSAAGSVIVILLGCAYRAGIEYGGREMAGNTPADCENRSAASRAVTAPPAERCRGRRGPELRGQDVEGDEREVDRAAGDDERVEDLVEAEPARVRVRAARGVDERTERVQDAARDEQRERRRAEPRDELAGGDQRQPADDQIRGDAEPARRAGPERLHQHPGAAERPDEREH